MLRIPSKPAEFTQNQTEIDKNFQCAVLTLRFASISKSQKDTNECHTSHGFVLSMMEFFPIKKNPTEKENMSKK
jgi:hypothetical protein